MMTPSLKPHRESIGSCDECGAEGVLVKHVESDLYNANLCRQCRAHDPPPPYYLATSSDELISNHRTLAEAKKAARLRIATGRATVVDVVHRTKHGHYIQGVMKDDGWSPV